MSKKDATQPQISANELAKFIDAKSARQRQILRNAKFPGEFMGMYYREASHAIAQCIASNLENVGVLETAVSVLEQQTPEKIGTQRRVDSNIDAIETFAAMLDDIDLKESAPSLGANTAPHLTINGVHISVRPEIILRGIGKSKAKLIGGCKFHFSRTNGLLGGGAAYVSTLLQEFARVHLGDEGDPYGPFCCVFDIGRKQMCPGVKSTINRMKDVEAACKNITALWPSITKDG
jgi:hypothetical protein